MTDETATNNDDGAIRVPMAVGEGRYFNRELSWLAFNQRVFEESQNQTHPLLERLRFLSISASNLDEFFMVRVAGLMAQKRENFEELSQDGMTVTGQLEAIATQTERLVARQHVQLAGLLGDLTVAGVRILFRKIDAEPYRERLTEYFDRHVAPVLTPEAIERGVPFPFIPNRGLAVVFDLLREPGKSPLRELIVIPQALPRFVKVDGAGDIYVAIDALLELFADRIFPGFMVTGVGRLRVLRDSDMEIDEGAEDLVQTFRSAIRRRRRGNIVLIEFSGETPSDMANEIVTNVRRPRPDVLHMDGMIGLADLAELAGIDRPELKFDPYNPRFPERIRDYNGDCFAAIRSKDILVHHPYESFDVVLSFLRQAAADPDVHVIKQTLYRAGDQSPVISALIDAAEAGKAVTAVVELKARFDEERNLRWADQLERAGVRVVYGFLDWKTHAKVSMVVRREGDGYRTYCHFGTGNYHPVTARIYTDFSYFTAEDAAGRDAARLFDFITGHVEPAKLEALSLSPTGLRARILELIDAEIANAVAGKPSGIWAKMNSLVDTRVIDKLYEASAAGVPIDLIVRGICCLRPGVPGLSETIRVKSVVGRFLEHARVFAFANGAPLPSSEAIVLLSSADWMTRNFDRRVEYMIPITTDTVHDQLLNQVLVANLLDNQQSWALQPSGEYIRIKSEGKPFNLHHYFMTNPSLSGRGDALRRRKDVPLLDLERASHG